MIDITNVTFGYGRTKVLDNFSLTFDHRGVYGLLGKNGTGKSTLLYLLSGLLRPQRGTVTCDDYTPKDRSAEMLQDLFLVPEEYDLPAIPLRRYVSALRPLYPMFSDDLLHHCLSAFELSEDIHLGELSMGQKKKVYMSIAIAANTGVLLLDEPTNGLDILSKSQFRQVITAAKTTDKMIIISTHQVHDIEAIVDHIIIIDRNSVLLQHSYSAEAPAHDLEQLFINTLQDRQQL